MQGHEMQCAPPDYSCTQRGLNGQTNLPPRSTGWSAAAVAAPVASEHRDLTSTVRFFVTTSATLGTGALRVEPGSTTSVVLTVKNDSDIVEAYRFAVVGGAANWTTFVPATISVFPGKSENVTVTFAPPRLPTTAPGELDFGIRVIPSEREDNATVPEGSLAVLPFFDTTAELLPRMSHGRRSVRPQVAIDNRGNTTLRVVLDGKDPSDQVSLTPSVPEVMVAPGAAAFAEVRVRARKSMLRGQNTPHPFLLMATPEGQRPIPLDGTFLQVPVLPPWAIKAIVAALAVLAALVLLFLTVLKPALESAAQSAQAAQQSAAAAQKATGSKVTPPPTTSTAPVKSTTSFWLSQTNGTTQYTPPNKATLSITDLVFENPQGDYGEITLTGASPLFQLSLADFRSDDYHFLTPITIAPGQKLVLSGTCTTKGTLETPSGTGTQANNCDDSVLVSGTLLTPKS
jgi:hypothetical protein